VPEEVAAAFSPIDALLCAPEGPGISPIRAAFASFREKLLEGQLRQSIPFATLHRDAPLVVLIAKTHARSSSFKPNGKTSIDGDFLISHRTFVAGLTHVTQIDPEKAIDPAMDRQARRQSARLP
jgi:hypothetical protein